MIDLTPDTVVAYLMAANRLPPEASVRVTQLAWGVSNIVLRVDPQGLSPLVVKQSQPQLRTQIEWLSRCERIYREADTLRMLQTILPQGVVPRVLFEDRPNYVLGLEAIRADHQVWKASLLQGELQTSVSETLGEYLAAMHGRTWNRPQVLPDAEDWSLFDELRIDPFYRWLARGHADVADALDDLIAEMAAHRVCLVHADFSPKNVLVHPDGVSLVDFETAHFGDPAFDVGLLLSHLLLKSRLFPGRAAEWKALIAAFWSTYKAHLIDTVGATALAGLSQRAVRHLAACAWARVDGKSPVDYLHDASHQEFIRRTARSWLRSPPCGIDAAVSTFFSKSLECGWIGRE